MALIKCKDCGAEYSDNAAACVKCGNPTSVNTRSTAEPPRVPQVKDNVLVDPKTQVSPMKLTGLKGFLITFGVVIFAIWFFVKLFSNSSEQGMAKAAEAEQECSQSVTCAGKKGWGNAEVYCKEEIEKHARYSVRWTEGSMGLKFSNIRWKNGSPGVITYIGDEVEFQNAYGAYARMTYECDMVPNSTAVLAVRVSEGRL